MTALSYTCKTNAFSPLLEFTATPEGLMMKGSQSHALIPWSDISEVRLSYEPSRFDYNRYFCRLFPKNGAAMSIASTTYQGIGNFVLQATEYRAMVREIHAHLQEKGQNVRYLSGIGWLRYIFNVVFLLLVFAVLVAVMLMVGAAYLGGMVIIKLIFIVAALPWVWMWIRKNRPASYDPSVIPESMLPKETTKIDHSQPPPLPPP